MIDTKELKRERMSALTQAEVVQIEQRWASRSIGLALREDLERLIETTRQYRTGLERIASTSRSWEGCIARNALREGSEYDQSG